MAINFLGYVFQDDGDPVSGATVALLETGTTTQEDSTTTNSDGLWSFSESDQDRYDVKISSGTSVRYIRWDDQISLKEIDVRNNTAAATPAATFTNLYGSASNQVAVFSGANSTKADNDEIYLSFKMHDSAGNLDEFARMTVVATDVSTTTEDGQIEFDVMKAGTLTKVWTITSSAAGAMSYDLNVDALTIGSGADTDVSLTFDANSADGVITWMEDEDYFKFSDDILMNSTERINFYDTAIYIYSSTDGQLDLVADTEIQIAATTIDINGAVALNGAITGATNITLSGELDAATLDLSSSADIAGDLVLSGGADGALQFTNAGENSIKIPDNQASALIIEEANNAYITFVTTNSSEAITVAKATTFSAGIANSGTIAAGTWNGTAIASGYIAGDAITGAKIADDAVDSEHYTDGSIDTAHLADDAITSAKIADDAVVTAAIADDAITSALIADDAIVTAAIADDAITSALIADDAVVTAAIADDAITSALIADDAVVAAAIADDAVDSNHYAAASVDFAHIQNVAANSILGRNANDSGVLSEVALATTQILIGDGTGFTAAALSGDATMNNAGAVTIASSAIPAGMLNTDVIASQGDEISSGLAAADELLYSDGGTLKKVGLDNFVELSPALATEDAIANGDYILFLDGGASGNMNKEAVHDLATLFAGGGLTATNSVIAVDAASESAAGRIEIATAAQITTSTSDTLAMTPGRYSDSIYGTRYIQVIVADPGTALTTGSKAYVHIPAGLNGMDLVEVHAEVQTAPAGESGGTCILIQIHNATDSSDMLTAGSEQELTIDASHTGSDQAGTAAVIDTGEDDVETNDVLRIDIDQVGSSTAGSGLIVTMGFRIPAA